MNAISDKHGFRFNEEYLSQIPALQQLVNLGFEYLTPAQALIERGGKVSNVLLESVLRQQLKASNCIQYKGNEYLFSEENIQSAIQKLKNVKYDGLQKTNEVIYELIIGGTALEQTIEGDSKSFTLNYIDWKTPGNNLFHVTSEFSVERSRSTETARPDIVLFVNGIPFSVIECKSPKVEVKEAISQSIRNQGDEYIPRLFIYVQQVLAVNKNQTQYATTGTLERFWGIWRESVDRKEQVAACINTPLANDVKDALFSGCFKLARKHFDAMEAEGERLVSEQDKAIYSLCRPERLLELAYKFTVFDGGVKKIARYQQYFVIKSTLEQVKQLHGGGQRQGGVIWHTQGSGKSLTMVMLAKNLALDPQIPNPRIVLVTDRDDLDKQLGDTFVNCGLDLKRARSGRHLLELVSEHKVGIITTLIHKFDKALKVKKFHEESSDIFMLIDESHRTNFGSFADYMRQMFPNACYLGFTGTPLLKSEKNNFTKFGGLIEPHYSIEQAVSDKVVLPLLYEGRYVEIKQDQKAIDLWFDRHTKGLTKAQQADLKEKYARAEMLNKADPAVYMCAFDISEHYRSNWQGTGFKAQLVAPEKATALKYHKCLNDIGVVSSKVIISKSDTREGHDEVDEGPTDEVGKFWKKMMKDFGSESEYNKQIINQFKRDGEPEILIVVNKLLTGFDAPRNAVLYLCRPLCEHTLLQAIARVNRLFKGKNFGYIIDYVGVLDELDKAFTMYSVFTMHSVFEGFDEDDLKGTWASIQEEISKLPQRYSELWDLFKNVKNQHDEEAYEVLLGDASIREEFYQRLSEYSKTLAIALSSEKFMTGTDENKIRSYRDVLKRFQNLKAVVKSRYADASDYRDYDPKIKKLLDTHIQANKVIRLNAPVNIFDEKKFNQVKEARGVYQTKTTASRADTIAHATKRTISENMEKDPALYEKFSKLIQQAIDDFKAKRISDQEYLDKVSEIRGKVVTRQHDDIPEKLAGNEDAMAFFGILKPLFEKHQLDASVCEEISTDIALAIRTIFIEHRKVQFWDDYDAQQRVKNDIDDYLYEQVKKKRNIELTTEQMDEIIERSMQVARHRIHE